MRRYKLYYWLENYNSILPSSLPDEDYITAITPLIDEFLKHNYGNRDMLYDFYEYLDGATDATILAWIKQKIYLLFQAKNESYKRIYQGLTEEYNPLWNVDGIKTETHSGADVHKNSGNDVITNSGTDTHTIDSSENRDITHSGTDTHTISNTGTDTNTETNSGTDTVNENTAAFDNPAMIPKSQTQTINGKQTVNAMQRNTTTTDGLQHGETIADGLDVDTTDSFAHGHVITTQNGKQTCDEFGHVITMRRTGKIGVTKSTDLLRDHLDLWQGLSFLDIIAKDIINTICYSVI